MAGFISVEEETFEQKVSRLTRNVIEAHKADRDIWDEVKRVAERLEHLRKIGKEVNDKLLSAETDLTNFLRTQGRGKEE